MCEDSASFDLTSNDIGSAIQELKDLSEKMTDLIDNEEQSAQWGREPDFNLCKSQSAQWGREPDFNNLCFTCHSRPSGAVSLSSI